MDTGKLFSELVNRQPDQSGGILTGTAVSDSVDGSVMVQMDGSVVAQPGEDEVTLTVSADDFVDGAYVLPSVPYAGSLTITDSDSNELEEQDYELDGARLTIFALSSSPIDISYQTQVQQQITNDDFDGDRYSLASTTNLSVEEMASDGSWSPAAYTLDGNILTISGIEHQAGIVEFSYIYDVSVVCEPGENVLPDSPDEVSVLGRNSSGVDVVVTDYVLEGSVITLPSTYDAYTVDYPVTTTETWNVSDQYQEEPLEDSDDAADPATVTIGHNLQWPPASVVSCTIDGTAATYALDDVNVVVDAPAVTERWFRLTYDAPVSLQVPASVFATGAFTLPSIPLGSVSTVRAGVVLENVVDDDQLTIASLVVDSPTYSIAYTEQVEQDVVELPCTPYVAEGQFVEIAVVNGMPTVIGASGSGDVTMTLAGEASDAAQAAEDAAEAAQAVADRVSEHFWTDTDGVHVTEVTEEEWNDSTGQSYHSGANVLISSIGQLFRTGLNNLLGFVTSPVTGVAIFDGLGNAAANIVGLFTDSGLVLGRSAETHAEVDYHSLRLIDREGHTYFHVSDLRDQTGVATITETFYSTERLFRLSLYPRSVVSVQVNGTDVSYQTSGQNVVLDTAPSASDTTVIVYETESTGAKAYTIGSRNQSKNVGGMSYALGVNVAASGYLSHAEGYHSLASGIDSHAEGMDTVASEFGSHAEGQDSVASGNTSHAQNKGTIAASSSQTALGKYNVEDAAGTYAAIIGNGTDDNNRSNALTVDWSGNVTTAGNVSAVDVTASGDMSADTITTTGNATIGGSVSATGGTFTGNVSATGGTFTGAVSANSATLANPLPAASGGTGKTTGLQWRSLGSFTGTNSLTINLSAYSEVMVAAKFSHTFNSQTSHKLVTAVVAKQLLTTTAQELWLGGGKSSGGTANSGALRAICNITTTKVTGVISSADSTDHTTGTTWCVYAR